ncbi:ech hydrogenase subunit B [Desulfonatronum thiosulfatophilum]|uniref:Ech hydrogenase subunit B n=1 Tax=Desulfonatronum thiosulfatophilum TaxID=617002 RepID=A0A1G6A3I1_9BACT|nr:complex I subunit 1 family protein [Desulfonatronum thiosulfatophilum]SDB02945.1 ech hydrogenase subunit B [Desulfonatronum thiosulfatophilum]
MNTAQVLMALIAALFLAPLAVGVLTGVDRRITARLQSRIGPPILQPFYDIGKLLGKETVLASHWLAFCSLLYLAGAVTSVVLFFLQADLLLIFFVQAVGSVFLVLGALSVPSPYSQIGAHRELLQIIAYEPLLILVIVGFFMATGSFKIDAIYAMDQPLLLQMPLLFLVLGIALTIKLRKSPFDISGSHHAHQEIVRGVYTEYSGPYYAVVEIAHLFEIVLILGLLSLFWSTSVVGIIVLLGVTYFVEILIDNTTSRMTWRWMLGTAWATGITLSLINLLWLYYR